MIISEKYKYLFLETPHTASTAVSKELREQYAGKEILYKHANYHEFLQIATDEEKTYFVFAGVRNPLDEASSLFAKFLNDHKSNYTDPSKLIKNGGWVSERKVKMYNMVQNNKNFELFIKKFYPYVYTNNININKKHSDFIIYFERLNSDFGEVLKKLGIKQTRPLPLVNKSAKKEVNLIDKLSEGGVKQAKKVFGPFMAEWGYEYPNKWGAVSPGFVDKTLYEFAKRGRLFYSKHVKAGALKDAKILRNAVE